jgi:hypothetical protein
MAFCLLLEDGLLAGFDERAFPPEHPQFATLG